MARERLFAAVWRINKVYPVLIAALLLVNLGAYLFNATYFSPQVEALERELIARQSQLRQARARQGTTASPLEIYRQGEADLARFREAIPDRAEFTGLLEELFTLARAAGLNIDRISYSPKELPESGLLLYSLGFSVAGDYGQIKKFIHLLEQSRRIVAIEEVSLAGSSEPGREKIALNIRLSTYFTAGVS